MDDIAKGDELDDHFLVVNIEGVGISGIHNL